MKTFQEHFVCMMVVTPFKVSPRKSSAGLAFVVSVFNQVMMPQRVKCSNSVGPVTSPTLITQVKNVRPEREVACPLSQGTCPEDPTSPLLVQ